jgi:hypothetical protein
MLIRRAGRRWVDYLSFGPTPPGNVTSREGLKAANTRYGGGVARSSNCDGA